MLKKIGLLCQFKKAEANFLMIFVCFVHKVEKWPNYFLSHVERNLIFYQEQISGVQMKSWAGEALETVNCCAFLKRRLIGAS
jgi:hypothetical protein